eukprot:3598234-Amphidinium_carterae.1
MTQNLRMPSSRYADNLFQQAFKVSPWSLPYLTHHSRNAAACPGSISLVVHPSAQGTGPSGGPSPAT